MSQKTTTIISWVCIILSALLILFGCFAPSLLTGSSQCEKFDFTETGQIGDTIGGTMGPFVAIAGVLMTFIAFLMQVRANEIQREQLKKSFNMKLLENKIESRNALELLGIDIKIMLKSVEGMCNEIDDFCNKTDSRPTGDFALHFSPKSSHERYKSIDRNLLYSAFKNFVNDENIDQIFMEVYNKMDFYSEGMKVIYDNIYKPYTDDIMRIKNEIPQAYEKMIDAINASPYRTQGSNLLINRFNGELTRLVGSNGILDVFGLFNLLNDAKYNSIYSMIPNEYRYIVSKTNALITQNNLLSKELRKTGGTFRDTNIYGWLTNMSKIIEVSLKDHSVATIQAEYENKL